MAVRQQTVLAPPLRRVTAKPPGGTAPTPRARPRPLVVDALFFATIFTITFGRVSWSVGGAQVELADLIGLLFLVAFVSHRLASRDGRLPRITVVLGAFFAAFVLVYLGGFFNVETLSAGGLYAEVLAKFVLHFAFLVAAVAHVCRQGERFYWRVLTWFVLGFAANAVYGVLQLAVVQRDGKDLDALLLDPIGSSQAIGIDVFGHVGGVTIYRTNALTLTANHIGILLLVPLFVLLPLYLRLERGHRLRLPLAGMLVLAAFVELTTFSRSAVVGAAVGLLVLALAYRRLLLSSRLLIVAASLAAAIAIVGPYQGGVLEAVLSARANSGGLRSRTDIWQELPPALERHPLLGLGLGTFPVHYEFDTGTFKGPHSYYVEILSETGILGTALSLGFLAYLFRRLSALLRLGRSLSGAGDAAAIRVRALAWGLTAALAATLAANAFLMTVTMFYFFVFALLVVTAPLVFGRRRALALAPGRGEAR